MNLPPGCRDEDLPGNSDKDIELDLAFEKEESKEPKQFLDDWVDRLPADKVATLIIDYMQDEIYQILEEDLE